MKKRINYLVFIPSYILIAAAAIYGLVDGKGFANLAKSAFTWILQNFGWLFQTVSMASFFIILALFLSKKGNVRFGGPNAKPKFSFMSWFAMALTGGIAIGVVLWGVNEPIIYFKNVWKELDYYNIDPGSTHAAVFAIGRVFYNWTFIPYAMYALSGVLIAYLYFNKSSELTVSASLKPVVGKLADNNIFKSIVDIFALLAIALGLSAALGGGLTFVSAALSFKYGIAEGPLVWTLIATIITIIFTFASYKGIEKGIKLLADFNTKMYFFILILLFLVGNTVYILSLGTTGLGYWLSNFFNWGFDAGYVNPALIKGGLDATLGGSALIQWWTLYDWAMWIAFAPLMGIFLAVIAYGRTIREFLIVNWILPSVFGLVWFSIWGVTAIHWQATGEVNILGAIENGNAISGMWAFVDHINIFGINIGWLIIPIMIITLIVSFATAADAMTTSIATLCSKDVKIGEEPKGWVKVLWGVTIGVISLVLVASVGGSQGLDGVKFMSAVGGFAVLVIFIVQIISIIKVLFVDEVSYEGSDDFEKQEK